jgi:predicted membrane channel-forming protein YqfA (hemolysin III family)
MEEEMKLSRPKNITFWIAVILGVLGLIGYLKVIPGLSPYAFWLVFVGLVVLVMGNVFKNF